MQGSPENDVANDPKIGMLLLDRYRITRKLGEGGMGSVYEAEHTLIGKSVAIKTLHADFASNYPDVVERFKREARAATAIGHEHIIDVTDLGALPDGSPFMVMERLEGREFAHLIEEEGALPIGRAVRIMLQVCDALTAAHSKGIVHRDLKPENIFLVPRSGNPDFVKVLDFGISKMKENAERLEGNLTKTGMAMGTPHYMSPEQAQGARDMDHRTDIYALGVILYQALTGVPPFDAPTYPVLMVKVLTEKPGSVRMRRPDVSPELDEIVQRALAKIPGERFASCVEFAAALRPFARIDTPVDVADIALMPTGQPPAPGARTAAGHGVEGEGQSPGSEERRQLGEMATMAGYGTASAEAVQAPSTEAAGTPLESPSANVGGATQLEQKLRPKKRGVAAAGIALAAVGLVGLAAGLTILSSSDEGAGPTPAPPKTAASAPEQDAPAATPAQAPTRVQDSAPAEVRIQITAMPADAKIFIGDVQYPNPVDAPKPRTLEPIQLRIEREGYKTVEQPILFDRDQSFGFHLEKVAPEPVGPARRSTRRRAAPSMESGAKMNNGGNRFRDDF